MNKFHAIFDTGVCPAVHASDTAVALCAVNARVLLMSSDGARMLPLEEFFVGPDEDATVENVLQPGEIVAEIVIPGRLSEHAERISEGKGTTGDGLRPGERRAVA